MTGFRETKGHSVTRTTVARTEDPLDQAIETMITKSTKVNINIYCTCDLVDKKLMKYCSQLFDLVKKNRQAM